MADGEQELLLGGARPRELFGHLIEGMREAGDLVCALDRNELGIAFLGEMARGVDHPPDGPGDPPGEQEGGERCQRDTCPCGDQQTHEEGVESSVSEPLRAQ